MHDCDTYNFVQVQILQHDTLVADNQLFDAALPIYAVVLRVSFFEFYVMIIILCYYDYDYYCD